MNNTIRQPKPPLSCRPTLLLTRALPLQSEPLALLHATLAHAFLLNSLVCGVHYNAGSVVSMSPQKRAASAVATPPPKIAKAGVAGSPLSDGVGGVVSSPAPLNLVAMLKTLTPDQKQSLCTPYVADVTVCCIVFCMIVVFCMCEFVGMSTTLSFGDPEVASAGRA